MKTKFLDFVEISKRRSNSLVCVGLDVDPLKIPKHLQLQKDGVWIFLREIIEATSDVVSSYKLNLAFFEALGDDYLKIVRKTLLAIPDNIVTIADGKRGDIGNTSEKYAKVLFEDLNFTAATVNPYMGEDSVEPFLRDETRGVFLLALTSNKGAKNFQFLKVGKRKLYEEVLHQTKNWGKKNLGFVIGATKASELKNIRKIIPNAPLLIPGIGAQGGSVKEVVENGLTKKGTLFINSSRGILYSSSGIDFAEAARKAAIDLKTEINQHKKY